MNTARLPNHMASFYFRGIGCLAQHPERITSESGSYYRFCLTSHDYTEDAGGRFEVEFQSHWFIADESTGELIAGGARKGDQIIVEGEIHKHDWRAKGNSGATFVVTAFQFGARRPPHSPSA